MTSIPFGLRPERGDPGAVDDLVATGAAERIGLAGVLAAPGRRAWPACTRGRAAVLGFRWDLRDTFDGSWWPQGIDVGEHDGRRVLAVSWYARPVRGVDRGVRVTFADLRHPRRPRYHHVLLMEPARDPEGAVRLEPVVVHAGGIGWSGGTLLVADTFGGVRTFALEDLLRVPAAPFGYAHVLPQRSRWRADHTGAGRGRRLRMSFLSLERGEGLRLVAGEYGNTGTTDRLIRLTLDAGGALVTGPSGVSAPLDVHEPGLRRMQGVCVVDGTWFLTTSNGERRRGDLWAGVPGDLRRHRAVLPPGPEDLAVDPVTGMLWSLSEWPGRRRVFQIDPARWR